MTWDNKSIIKRTYAAWRDEIPWTNAEIVQALRADTTDRAPYLKERRERTALYLEKGGRLSKKILSMALPLLITKCTLCGKKALYRKGSRGYCRAHRANIPKYTGHVQYFGERAQEWKERDREERVSDRLRTFRRSSRQKDRRS